ncbi:GGDEF domain-containing protein [Paraburkholderia dinghuensis]|uniref:diguanylate cyclase n=1 Tax=Paraburkholderia dinghuensis TaxID=2305225 RepID=A0A3N6N7W3_9BURK|nr:GGDEF domain-containing protein [Paraburkholderia dinghuensis]RQH06911.1 diguanylate cyclase [Paraburkholderia dinghuensis]
MGLKFKITLLTLLVFAATAVAAIWMTRSMLIEVMEDWGRRFAEHQVRHYQTQVLEPIAHDLSIAKEMARAPEIVDWAADPDNENKKRTALVTMEAYRRRFRDHSWFMAMSKGGGYYYNNQAGDFAGKELRYTLDKNFPRDQWFFTLLRQSRDVQVNVDTDAHLGVTNVWLNLQIRDKSGNDVLAIGGTGFNLVNFIGDRDLSGGDGVDSLLVDKDGAIQISRDLTRIDFASLTHEPAREKTIFSWVASPNEAREIRERMDRVLSGATSFEIVPVHIGGRKFLIGLAALRDIGWVEVTILDLSKLLPGSSLERVTTTLLVAMLLLLTCWYWILRRSVFQPLTQMRTAMSKVAAGEKVNMHAEAMPVREMRELFQQFSEMAEAVQRSRQHLETEVKARTIELEKLKDAAERQARMDALTGLANRLAFHEVSGELAQLSKHSERPLSLVMIDIDNFKSINDKWGHDAGDAVLRTVADLLASSVRRSDLAARLGGEEFVVVLTDTAVEDARVFSERLRLDMMDLEINFNGERIRFTSSFGVSSGKMSEMSIAALLNLADASLYRSKNAGRNRVTVDVDLIA